MAQVYGPPEGLEVPDLLNFQKGRYGFDMEAYTKAEESFVLGLVEWCRKRHPEHDLVGELVKFPVGDGYAIYVVADVKPLTLVHVPVGDAWQIPKAHARGLRLDDIAEMVKRRKALDAAFSAKREEQPKP